MTPLLRGALAVALTTYLVVPLAVEAKTIYLAPRSRDGTYLGELLNYKQTVQTASSDKIRWDDSTVYLDKSNVVLHFQSDERAPGYSYCIRYQFKTQGDDWTRRSGCYQWFDTELHTIKLLSAEEANRLEALTVHNFDVKGRGARWDGAGDPGRMLAHQETTYSFVSEAQLAAYGEILVAWDQEIQRERATARARVARARVVDGSQELMQRARETFDRSASDIVKCFHPTQKFSGSEVSSARSLGDDQARISGRLTMKGVLGYYYMNVDLYYDHARSKIRVVPGDSDTRAPANTNCGLRDWTSTGSVADTRQQAQQRFRNNVVTGAAGVAAVVLLSSEQARKRVFACTKKAAADGVIDSVAERALSAPAAQAIVSGALKQVYAEKAGVGDAARNAAAYALKQAIEKRDPDLARAIDVAEYLYCMVK